MLSPSRLVNKSTCRIVCDNGRSIGTGFFFVFQSRENESIQCPVLVTNKHVIHGSSNAVIRVNVINEKNPGLRFFDLTIPNVGKNFIMHPDPNVDLCILPIFSFFEDLKKKQLKADVFFFSEENMNGVDKVTPVEEVFMTGYPNGLWDEANNKPITRKGITASDVNIDWNGKAEFMIDMACFGGSSGSPVYIMNEGSYVVDDGIAMGTRLIFLGILYAGPLVNVNGTVQVVDVPTAAVAVSSTQMMMNLGIVIKARKLLDFKSIIGI